MKRSHFRSRDDVEEQNEILFVNVNRNDLTASIYCVGAVMHPITFLNKRKRSGHLSIQSGFHGAVFSELRQLLARRSPLNPAERKALGKRLGETLDEKMGFVK
jgi:hypothetical protein